MVYSNLMLGIACFFFFVGSILFKNEASNTIGLLQEGVVMFIIGSVMFLGAAVIGVYLRSCLENDPLKKYRSVLESTFIGLGNMQNV